MTQVWAVHDHGGLRHEHNVEPGTEHDHRPPEKAYAVLQTARVCEHCGVGLASVLVSTQGSIPRQPWMCARCGCADMILPEWVK